MSVGYWKKGTGRPSLTWSEAVDQALCFGWIDSRADTIDSERYRQRFTPRRPGSNWSKVNIEKVERLEAEGLMRPAGRAAFEARSEAKSGVYSFEQEVPVELAPAYVKRFRRQQERVGVLERAAAGLPPHGHALGDEREARGDARAQARSADRELRGRRAHPAAAPAPLERAAGASATPA